jgi:hypothetical protein
MTGSARSARRVYVGYRTVGGGGLRVMDLARFSRAIRIRWLCSTATRVTVHNGRRESFWMLSWLDGMSPAGMFPALFKHSKRKKIDRLQMLW